MKFFSLCLFILSSFFAVADNFLLDAFSARTPVPEEDMQYLQQEEDENGYGCIRLDAVGLGRSIQKPDGTWVDQHPERVCDEYCRPSRSGDENVHVQCSVPNRNITGDEYESYQLYFCSGVGDTQEEATAEAKSICIYRIRQRCNKYDDCRVSRGWADLVSCKLGKICFNVDYENGKYYID